MTSSGYNTRSMSSQAPLKSLQPRLVSRICSVLLVANFVTYPAGLSRCHRYVSVSSPRLTSTINRQPEHQQRTSLPLFVSQPANLASRLRPLSTARLQLTLATVPAKLTSTRDPRGHLSRTPLDPAPRGPPNPEQKAHVPSQRLTNARDPSQEGQEGSDRDSWRRLPAGWGTSS